jgi:hypothetical protein
MFTRLRGFLQIVEGGTLEDRGMLASDGRLWRAGAALPTIGQCQNHGYGWLEVECHRCKTRASLLLDAIRRPCDTPIWKLEAALKCRSCKKRRCAPPVHMIKLTQLSEITPYVRGSSQRR